MGRFRSLLLDRRFFQKSFPGTAYSTLKHAPVTAYGSNIRNIGLLIGSLISILFSKRFSIKKIRFGKQVLVSEGYYKQKKCMVFHI